jgi:hypothetical protein
MAEAAEASFAIIPYVVRIFPRRPPEPNATSGARPKKFSFQNSQDISVPRVFKRLRKVI